MNVNIIKSYMWISVLRNENESDLRSNEQVVKKKMDFMSLDPFWLKELAK